MAERRWTLPVAIVAVAAFYVVLFALAPAHLPALNVDSEGYLAVGRWVAGAGVKPEQVSSYYAFGYGLILALPYLFTQSIHAVYAFAVALNVLAGALLVLPLRALLREAFGLDSGRATLAAVGGAAYGGVALQVGQVWPVTLLALGVAGYALVLLRLLRAPSNARALALSALAIVLFALHHRMAPVAIVTVLVFAQLYVTGARWSAVAGFALLVVGVAAVLVGDRITLDALYPLGTGAFGVTRAVRTGDVGTTLRILVGELWYVVVATLGLAPVGIAALVSRRGDGLSSLGSAVVLAGLGTAVLGALQIAGAGILSSIRLDYLSYGRYVDPYVPLLVGCGLASLLALRRWWPLLGATTVVVGTAVQVAVQGDTVFRGAYQKSTVPGILGANAVFGGGASPFGEGLTYVGIAAVALLVAVGVGLLSSRRSVLAAVVPVAAFGVLGLVGARVALRPYYQFVDGYYTRLPAYLARYPRDASVAFVARGETVQAMNRLQMFEPWRRIVVLRTSRSRVRRLPALAVAPAGLRTVAGARASEVAVVSVPGSQPQALYELRSISSIR